MAGSIKSVLVRLKGDSSDLDRALLRSAAAAKTTKRALDDADDSTKKWSKSLEVSNDRTTMLIQGALALGPALVPIGAQAVPIFMGLAAQLGAIAAGAGVTALAFSGIGDTLKAVNDYELQPTEAHLAKMRLELSKLGPAGQEFVHYLQDLRPELQRLQDIAQEGMLPGVQDGIEELMTKLPGVEKFVYNIATTLGDLSRDAAADLAGEQWAEFFDYIETEGAPLLSDFSRTVGNFAQGIADMFVAFDPMTRDFSEGMLNISRSFAEWADGLDESESFRDFADYIKDTGPQVWETLGSISEAMIAIVTAAAPVGKVALPVIEALADSLKVFMASPLGPALIGIAAGFSALSRAIALAQAANASAFVGSLTGIVKGAPAVTAATKQSIPTLSQFGTVLYRAGQSSEYASEKTLKAREAVSGMKPVFATAAAGVGVLALSMTDLDDKMGVSNTAMGVLMGSMLGPWGAAIGGAIGATMDFAAANDQLDAALSDAEYALSSSAMTYDQQKAAIDAAKAALDDYEGSVNRGKFGALNAGEINDVGDAFGHVGDTARAFFDFLTDSGDEGREAIAGMEDEFSQMPGAVASSTRALQQHRESILANVEAMRALREERLRAENAELNYLSSINQARDAVEKNGKVLKANGDLIDETNDEAIAAKQALLGMAAGWNDLSDKEKNADGAHRQAINTFVRFATQMGMNEEAARRYAQRLMEIPPERKTAILVDAGQAFRMIDGVKMALRNLDGTVSETYIRTIRQTVIDNRLGNTSKLADGGEVLGQRYPYGDKVLVYLAPGEEVISNRYGQADRFRRDRAAGIIPAYADGGTVRATPQSSVTNHYSYGRSGPMELVGEIRIPGLGWTDMRAIASDVYRAEKRQDDVTGAGRRRHG